MKLRKFILLIPLAIMACSKSPEDAFKGEFLSGCMKSGGSKASCQCVMDKLLADSSQETMRILKSENPNYSEQQSIARKMFEAARSCR